MLGRDVRGCGVVPIAGIRRWLCAVCASVLTVGLTGGVAVAQSVDGEGTDQLVTIAARSCPSYEAISANLARNDIQESLQDLGPDTLYTSGEPISPAKEDEGQPTCTPLPDWQFTWGRGIGGAVQGSWGSLSYVSSPESPTARTALAVPALDEQGRPVPGAVIRGATTVELSSDQADAAAGHNLWIQGGTVSDPVLDQVYPGATGSARCAARSTTSTATTSSTCDPRRRPARVLLRVLRDAAAVERHDRRSARRFRARRTPTSRS